MSNREANTLIIFDQTWTKAVSTLTDYGYTVEERPNILTGQLSELNVLESSEPTVIFLHAVLTETSSGQSLIYYSTH